MKMLIGRLAVALAAGLALAVIMAAGGVMFAAKVAAQPPRASPPPQSAPMNLDRINEVRARVSPRLKRDLAAEGFNLGDAVFIRIFKESRELELWLKPKGSAKYRRWKKWPIAAMSGNLGPKLKMGDLQAPEGFYSVTEKSLNPMSRFHLSFNVGYPNAYDEAQGCTGSLIMVHGNQVSIGCFAMTDPVIEEIYVLTEAALIKGQKSIPVHVFPFRMTAQRMGEAAESQWLTFWKSLQAGYETFEITRVPPAVKVERGEYHLE